MYISKKQIMSRCLSKSLRDYLAWVNLPVARSNFFITYDYRLRHQRQQNALTADLLRSVATCLAKYLLVDYKLNEYPYYDLTVVNVFSNYKQSMEILSAAMRYLEPVVDRQLLSRVKVYMMPLYPSPQHPGETRQVSENVWVLGDDQAVFGTPATLQDMRLADLLPLEYSTASSIAEEDPVHVVMFDDVLQNLAPDLVRVRPDCGNVNTSAGAGGSASGSASAGEWEQCFVNTSDMSRTYLGQGMGMDPLCELAVQLCLPPAENVACGTEVYVPSQAALLFSHLKRRFPEHKLFAVDSFEVTHETMYFRWKSWLAAIMGFGTRGVTGSGTGSASAPCGIESSSLVLGYTSGTGTGTSYSHRALKLVPNAHQCQLLYTGINDGRKACTVEPLDTFIDKWRGSDLPAPEAGPFSVMYQE